MRSREVIAARAAAGWRNISWSAGDLRPYDLAKPVGGYQKAEPEVVQSADEFIATIFATQLEGRTGQYRTKGRNQS
jgi:hypothetical protein